MNQPKPKIVDPSIDDMLTSIRDAIHEETAREAEEHARTFTTRTSPGDLKPQARHPVPPAPNRAPNPPSSTPSTSRNSSVSGSMRELRVSLQPAGQAHSRGTVTARSEDFLSLKNKLASLRQSKPAPSGDGELAKIMGGDPRLDDAIDRMAAAEQLQRQNTPVPPRAETQAPPQTYEEAPIRGATLDDVSGEQPDITYSPQEEVLHEDAAEHDVGVQEFESASEAFEPAVATADVAAVLPEFTETPEPIHEHPVPQAASEFQQAPIQQIPVEPVAAQPAPIEATPIEPAPVEPVIMTPRLESRMPVQPEQVSMMSNEAMRAAGGAFERLSDELFSTTSGGAQVLEDSARDMIKPMLKNWLDDNLPNLVERLVREEIERVVRKGGR